MSGEAARGVEAAKWLGFALMVADHVNGFVLVHGSPVVYLLGRLVFPLFALALGFGLAGRGALTLDGVIPRLYTWAAISQVPWLLFAHTPLLNVLFTLAGGVVIYQAVFVGRWSMGRVFLVCGAFLAGGVAEYGIVGMLVVFASLWFAESKSPASMGLLGVALVALVSVNGTFFAVLAAPVFWALHKYVDLPRIRHLFYPAYAAHFVVLAFLRWWL